MDELLSQFIEIREEFNKILDRFPALSRSVVLFGDWNLKDLIAHLTGWDRYFVDILDSLQAGEEPPYWGNMTRFNKTSVQKRSASSWEDNYDEFVATGEEFIRRYNQLPVEFRWNRFWRRRSYTPVRILEINIHHYGSHLSQVKRKLYRLEKE
ncbi:MAG: maleylpyruvate isomerase N-terminal domain-containing protein [Candidatus Hodarchaeota archaeon]